MGIGGLECGERGFNFSLATVSIISTMLSKSRAIAWGAARVSQGGLKQSSDRNEALKN